MRLNFQVALPAFVVIILICGLMAYVLPRLSDIRQQSQSLQRWSSAIEHLQDANYSISKIRPLLEKLQSGGGDRDDLLFDLMEHRIAIVEHTRHVDVSSLMKQETRATVERLSEYFREDAELDPEAALKATGELGPKVDDLLKHFNSRKWSAYIQYYKSVDAITSQLISISLSVLLLAVLACACLTAWAIAVLHRKLGTIAERTETLLEHRSAQSPPIADGKIGSLERLSGGIERLAQYIEVNRGAVDLLGVVEAERKRIAMDMHDDVLSELTALSRGVADSKERTNPSISSQLQDLETIERGLENISNGIRAVIDDIHPYALESLGLEAALRSFLKKHNSEFGKETFTLHFSAGIEGHLDEARRVNLYRVALEVLDNTIRHANSTRCELSAHVSDGELVFIIEDNGKGFNGSNTLDGAFFGLVNVRERAKTLGAHVNWLKSRFSSGTRFELRMPVAAQALQGDN